MNKYVLPGFIIFAVFLISCKTNSSKTEIEKEVYSHFLQKGSDVSNLAQGVLLKNVGKAIQQGGTEHAVEFCNLQALALIDSLNQINQCKINRVSDKNRNPKNGLQSKADEKMWNYYSEILKKNHNDTLLADGNQLVYYKPIKVEMPTCLKCHGNDEISSATLHRIQKFYPSDLATGYKMNDLRGMWKIQFHYPE